MRTIYTFFAVTFYQLISYAQATTAIPDTNFENALINLGIDTNGLTGNILNQDALFITSLNISNENISSLVGISAFVDLQFLTCSNNNIATVNLNNNTELILANFTNNNLTSIDITQNDKLVNLGLGFNELESINISNNVLLTTLNCENNLLTEIDITNNINLEELTCIDNNISNITTLPNTLLIFFANNNELTNLNLTDISSLRQFRVRNNNFYSIDLSNGTSLAEIDVMGNNNLSTLDIRNGNNTNITLMSATNNSSLNLICVDDVSFSETASGWSKDNIASYSETCTLSTDNYFNLLTDFISKNPIKDQFQIPIEIVNNLKSLKLFNSSGQLVYSGVNTNINLKNTSSGLYIAVLIDKTGHKKNYKLVKL